jgi:hypothetical protein
MRVRLINHACCKVETDGLGLLFNPWTEGSAFNAGRDLLISTPWHSTRSLAFDEIMEGA